MEINNSIKYISLKKASQISDYSSDYIGFLIRNGRLSGKKVYKNISWQISLVSTIKYLKEHHSSNNKNWKSIFVLKNKYISLKKASRILGYSSDYLGSLIRSGEIKGKKVYLNSSWVTTRKALAKYKDSKEKRIEEDEGKIKVIWLKGEKLFLKKIQDNIVSFKNKVKGELTYCNNIYNNRRVFTTVLNGTFKASLISVIIFSLVLTASPIVFLQSSIGTIFAEEEKIINFYSSVSAGDWQGLENVQSLPEVGPLGTIDSFSESNSAIYENGPLFFIIEDFQSDFDADRLNGKQIESAKIKFSFAIGEKEADILIEPEGADNKEETGDAEDQIGFWNKIKNFFKTLAIKTINLVKASLNSLTRIVFVVRAEGEINEGEQDIVIETQETNGEVTEEVMDTEIAEEETGENIEGGLEAEELVEEEDIVDKDAEGEQNLGGEQNVEEEQVVEEQPEKNTEESIEEDTEENPDGDGESSIIEGENTEDQKSGCGCEKEETTNEKEVVEESQGADEGETIEEEEQQEQEEQEGADEQGQEEQEESGEDTITGTQDASEEETASQENVLPNIDSKIIIWYSLDDQEWQEIDTISDYPLSNALNNGYFEYDASFLKNWEDIENLKIKFEGVVGGETNIIVYLDSVWVEVNYGQQEEEGQGSGSGDQGPNTTEEITIIEPTADDSDEEDTEEEFEEETDIKESAEDTDEELEIEEEEEDVEENIEEEPEEEEPEEELDEELEEELQGEIESLSEKDSFKSREEPRFRFKYKYKNVSDVYPDWSKINIRIKLKNPQGESTDISPDFDFGSNGEIFFKLNKPRAFKPGIYKLILVIEENGQTQKIEQTFTWGVLAINTNKSIYLQNETAYLQMAVLDHKGHTICDASLKLEITDSNFQTTILSTQDGTIQYSGKCGPDNIIDVPDYFAYYQVEESGIYQMKLINLDNGYQIDDSFEVREWVPFDIERIGPTRIYPPADYGTTLKIKANQDFSGEIIEKVPESFEIIEANESRIFIQNDTKEIIWHVDWNMGEEYEIKYQFNAPDISPYLYLLGPLEIGNFSEIRQWQIASDAPDITLFSTTTAMGGNDRITELLINKPAGQDDDVFIAHFSTDGNNFANSVPDGWTEIYETDDGKDVYSAAWYKVITDYNSEPANYTWYFDENQSITGAIMNFRGVNTSNPINASSSGTGVSINPTSPEIETTLNNTLLLRLFGNDYAEAQDDAGYPSDYTGIYSFNDSAGDNGQGAAYKIQVAKGLTGTAQFTLLDSEQWVAGTIALAPPAALFITQKSYRWQNDDGDASGDPLTGGNVNNNTNSASADTSLEMEKGERAVWRVQLENEGDLATTTNYKVQWATTTGACTSSLSWTDVGASTEISYSPGLSGTNGESLTTSICASNSSSWTNGKWLESTSTIYSFGLNAFIYTEFGFMMETSNTATNTSYCLRIYNQASNIVLDTYGEYGKLTIVSDSTKRYSKDSVASLPSTTTDLTYFLDSEGYDDVETDDADRDPITSSSSIPVFLFTEKHTNNTDGISVSWDGQTNIACNAKAVYLQVYNVASTTWETFASSTSCNADEDFTLSTIITTNQGNYYDASYWNYIRAYQDLGTQTLKTDYVNIVAYVLDISGTVYTDEGSTGSTVGSTVNLVINSTSKFTTTASEIDGSYSFSDIAGIVSGDIITVFLDDSSEKGVTITRLSGPTISGFDIYKNRAIIRQEDSNAVTISNMNNYDSGQDADILYTADTNLTVNAEAELYIWPDKEFAPGGNVTLSAGGSGDAWDGSIKICSGSTFTAAGTESHSIGGSWTASSTATFTPANSTVTFTSTSTSNTITTASNSFYNLTFNGSGGEWAFQDAATSTNNLTISNGTVSSAYNMNVLGGGVTGNGTLSWTAGTFLVDGTGNFGGTSDWTFYNLTFGNGTGAETTTGTSTGTTTISSVLTIASNQTLNAGARIWTLSGSGTSFVINGTFNYQTSTFRYTANDDTYITATDYWNLELKPAKNVPDTPTNPSPANASTSVATSTTLSVDVYDPDSDAMTISFYNADTSDLIGTTSISAIQSTSTATTTWSGLSYGTTYQWYAVANDGTLNATSSTWSFTVLSFPCGSSVTFTYRGSSVTYDTVENPTTSECWLDRNLGATSTATAFNDSDAYGDLFQWGRLDDDHQVRTSDTTTTLSTTDDPGHNMFISAPNDPWDWRSGQNNNLWQGVDGTNNPCPSGWRIPTQPEWQAELESWSTTGYGGAFGSPLKLTAGGNRDASGLLNEVGSYGRYWSSTVSGTNARHLRFYDDGVYVGDRTRVYGFSVRCVGD